MKYVFVDMDGVIAEYGYPNGLYDGEFQKGNYVGKKPVVTIINEILEKYNNSDHIIMVCSASPNAKATLEKKGIIIKKIGCGKTADYTIEYKTSKEDAET